MACFSGERIEYELRVQAIGRGEAVGEAYKEVYHGWESSVSLGPFPMGSYEFMVRARNSIGRGTRQEMGKGCRMSIIRI